MVLGLAGSGVHVGLPLFQLFGSVKPPVVFRAEYLRSVSLDTENVVLGLQPLQSLRALNLIQSFESGHLLVNLEELLVTAQFRPQHLFCVQHLKQAAKQWQELLEVGSLGLVAKFQEASGVEETGSVCRSCEAL